MLNNNLQLIECVTTANKDYLQSLLAVGFYAIALKSELQELTTQLDYSYSNTQILLLDNETSLIGQPLTLEAVAKNYQEGNRRFYSAIRGNGGYLPTEKLLTYLQALKINTSINLLAFESTYNQLLALTQ